MRKLLIGILCISLLLIGCKREDGILDERFRTEDYLPGYDMRQDFNGYYPVCEQNGVYYYVLFDRYLRYYDSNTHISGVLCGKAECTHEDTSCNAYLGVNIGLCIYDNQIYWIGGDWIGGERIQTVQSMNLHGYNRRLVYEMDTYEINEGWPAMDIHRGYVYLEVIHSVVDDNGAARERVEIIEQEMSHPENAKTIMTKQYERPFLMCTFQGNHMYIGVEDNDLWEIYQYDIVADELTQLWKHEKIKSESLECIRATKDKIYIGKRDNSESVYRRIVIDALDLRDGSMKEVKSFDFTEYMFPFVCEDYILIYISGIDTNTQDMSDYIITDYEGNILYEGDILVDYDPDKNIEKVYYDYVGGSGNLLMFVRDCFAKDGYFQDAIVLDLETGETEVIWNSKEE